MALDRDPNMRPPLTKPSVLVLDDDRDLLEILSWSLRDFCDREAVAVSSYDELVRNADEALSCELALLDINLGPGKPSGVDALRWLEEHRFGGRVVFLTGHALSHPLVVQAMQTGRAGIVSKPISREDLVALFKDTHRSSEGATR